jgi:DNA-binding SARP family transcriptional activator/ABC-type branched-subunit amino acid transport system substrate-binding protein/streptogramin lyase
VPSDRLIDELWGDQPPADAQTALQQHVSRLRKALGSNGVLVTRAPGYALEVPAEQLDLARFRALVEQGRKELDGAPRAAARTLRKALALWRGPPLADLATESFAVASTHALEEERLAALESRIDAELACGLHAELVGELTSLVRKHPLREHLRAQSMLALYRSGRQADALEAYTDARRALVDELALEPGPELQRLQQSILAHDTELAAPQTSALVPRRPLVLLAAMIAAAVVAAALGVAIADLGPGDAKSLPSVTPGQGVVLALDASTGEVRRRIPAGRAPSAIAADQGVVWVVDADGQTVLRFAESSRVIDTFSTGATPTDVALGSGSAWVANGRPLENSGFTGPVATGVARLDATTGTERGEVSLRRHTGVLSNRVDNHVVMRGRGVWAVTPDRDVVRIDAVTGALTARTSAIPAAAVGAGPAGVWAVGYDGAVTRLHEVSAKPVVRTRIPASSIGSIAVGADAVWVTSPDEGTLWRIRARRSTAVGAIALQRGVSDLAVSADGAVWVANTLAGSLTRIDPTTGTVVRTVDLGVIPRSLATDGGTLWVAATADPVAATPKHGGLRTFPDAVCEPVEGDRASDLLIVSDLPLQMGSRVPVMQMSQAIRFALDERGFSAGRFKVAYQSCDDSLARTGLYDGPRCASNARAYGANPDVVGVVGTLISACALAAVPELNRAAAGPLAMVSPLNSFVGLTRSGPGVDDSLPAALYPTGVRNFARVFPTDDLEGAALALFARDRGWKNVLILDDGQPWYGALQADYFEVAARRLGLGVLARESWGPRPESYARLARRVQAADPEAVYVGGLVDTNAAEVVRALRARLGRDVALLAPSGLNPVPLIVKRSRRAALGMYISTPGVVRGGFPPAGVRWAKRFAAAHPGTPITPWALYTAQATEVLLDAIARSDGTRASVLRELFATRIRNGLLGSFGFDANGDISERPVTIVRVDRAGSSREVMSFEGTTIASVERPSPRLVAPEE